MAVAPTGNIFKALSFDNVSSRTYGVYITGEAVYNAPEREVEMISIPGRNGAFALDKGRFENIEVTYPAGIFADSESNFAEAVSDFRNFLCSRKGYVRLTDEYNPNEYRMAVYKSGLEVEPAQLKAGEFEITFDCKPQRFLTSGETEVTVPNNGTLTNPTLFDANPLLAVTGYGNIVINGKTIEVGSGQVGDISLANVSANGGKTIRSLQITLDYSSYASTVNAGDPFRGRFHTNNAIQCKTNSSGNYYTIATIDGVASGLIGKSFVEYDYLNSFTAFPSSNQTATFTSSYAIVLSNNVSFTLTSTRTITNSTSGVFTMLDVLTTSTNVSSYTNHYIIGIDTQNVVIESSYSSLGNPTYIDLDIGEAYKISNNIVISLNDTVKLPAEPPTLKPGTNTFTKSNTVTQLKVTPRWWKV